MSFIRNAITEADGVTLNVGYLALFWLLWVVIGVIPVMVVMAILHIDVQPLGIAVGAVCGGFGTALAALGVFIAGDRRNQYRAEPPIPADPPKT